MQVLNDLPQDLIKEIETKATGPQFASLKLLLE